MTVIPTGKAPATAALPQEACRITGQDMRTDGCLTRHA